MNQFSEWNSDDMFGDVPIIKPVEQRKQKKVRIAAKKVTLKEVPRTVEETLPAKTTPKTLEIRPAKSVKIDFTKMKTKVNVGMPITKDAGTGSEVDSVSPKSHSFDPIVFDPLGTEHVVPRSSSLLEAGHVRSNKKVSFDPEAVGRDYLLYFEMYQRPAREEVKARRAAKHFDKDNGTLDDDGFENNLFNPVMKGEDNFADEDDPFWPAINVEPADDEADPTDPADPGTVNEDEFGTDEIEFIHTKKIPAAKTKVDTSYMSAYLNINPPPKESILSIDIGIKNLGYSVVTYVPNSFDMNNVDLMFGIVNISETATKNKTVIASRCECLHSFLSTIASKYNITKIIIEKQVPTNVKAMELMYAIYGMGINIVHDCSNIIIFDPKLKFTTLGVQYNTKNKQHKRQSIQYAHEFLNYMFPDILPKFENHHKKDDIADSMNQAFVWMISNETFRGIGIEDLKELYGIN